LASWLKWVPELEQLEMFESPARGLTRVSAPVTLDSVDSVSALDGTGHGSNYSR